MNKLILMIVSLCVLPLVAADLFGSGDEIILPIMCNGTSGGGNISGTLTTNRFPYATDSHIISSSTCDHFNNGLRCTFGSSINLLPTGYYNWPQLESSHNLSIITPQSGSLYIDTNPILKYCLQFNDSTVQCTAAITGGNASIKNSNTGYIPKIQDANTIVPSKMQEAANGDIYTYDNDSNPLFRIHTNSSSDWGKYDNFNSGWTFRTNSTAGATFWYSPDGSAYSMLLQSRPNSAGDNYMYNNLNLYSSSAADGYQKYIQFTPTTGYDSFQKYKASATTYWLSGVDGRTKQYVIGNGSISTNAFNASGGNTYVTLNATRFQFAKPNWEVWMNNTVNVTMNGTFYAKQFINGSSTSKYVCVNLTTGELFASVGSCP